MSQQLGVGARRTEIKCFKHSQNKSCITDVLMFYLLIYFTFASHRKMVRDGFSFSVPTTELTKLAKSTELHRNQEEKASWLAGFSIAFSAVLQWLLDLFCNQRGQLGTAWAQGMGKSGWHMAPQLLWDLRRIDFRWKGCVLPAPWVKEECVC